MSSQSSLFVQVGDDSGECDEAQEKASGEAVETLPIPPSGPEIPHRLAYILLLHFLVPRIGLGWIFLEPERRRQRDLMPLRKEHEDGVDTGAKIFSNRWLRVSRVFRELGHTIILALGRFSFTHVSTLRALHRYVGENSFSMLSSVALHVGVCCLHNSQQERAALESVRLLARCCTLKRLRLSLCHCLYVDLWPHVVRLRSISGFTELSIIEALMRVPARSVCVIPWWNRSPWVAKKLAGTPELSFTWYYGCGCDHSADDLDRLHETISETFKHSTLQRAVSRNQLAGSLPPPSSRYKRKGQFDFVRLPPELRIMIYLHIFQRCAIPLGRPTEYSWVDDFQKLISHPLLHVNHQIYREAEFELFRSNRFDMCEPREVVRCLRYFGQRRCQMLRKVSICLARNDIRTDLFGRMLELLRSCGGIQYMHLILDVQFLDTEISGRSVSVFDRSFVPDKRGHYGQGLCQLATLSGYRKVEITWFPPGVSNLPLSQPVRVTSTIGQAMEEAAQWLKGKMTRPRVTSPLLGPDIWGPNHTRDGHHVDLLDVLEFH